MLRWILTVGVLLFSVAISFAKPSGKTDAPVIYVFRPQVGCSLQLSESQQNEMRKMLAAELVRSGRWRQLPNAPDVRLAGAGGKSVTAKEQRPREIGKMLLPLGVDYFVIPHIENCEIVSGRPRRFRVSVVLQIHDSVTGVVGGAILSGESGETGDALATTLQNAARLISKGYPSPTSIVRSQGERWEIGQGRKQRFHPGMELIVVRNRRVVGSLRVISVEPYRSFAVTRQGEPAVGDRVVDRQPGYFSVCITRRKR